MINKCLFPAAGYGTRFLPATKAVPKEMLPILTKPLLQYGIEEALSAGIINMAIVTGRGKRSIEDHFDNSFELESQLIGTSKEHYLNEIRDVIRRSTFTYIRQKEILGLGHAILTGEPLIGNEPFAVILADDLCECNENGVVAQMIEIYNQYHCSIVAIEEVSENQTNKYGIIAAEKITSSSNDYLVTDYICPTPKTRKLFKADYLVWVDTIDKGRFEDTNKMFVKPEKFDFRVTTKNAELWAYQISDKLIPYKWDNKKPTAQMLGRWQPFHDGHYALFEEILKKTGQVYILVRDVQNVDDNPFDFEYVKSKISEKLESKYKNRYKIVLVPNITNICYGRGVGYKIEEVVLPESIQKISATKIRAKMRKTGKLER